MVRRRRSNRVPYVWPFLCGQCSWLSQARGNSSVCMQIVNGTSTDIVQVLYRDRVMVVITQRGKMGALVRPCVQHCACGCCRGVSVCLCVCVSVCLCLRLCVSACLRACGHESEQLPAVVFVDGLPSRLHCARRHGVLHEDAAGRSRGPGGCRVCTPVDEARCGSNQAAVAIEPCSQRSLTRSHARHH